MDDCVKIGEVRVSRKYRVICEQRDDSSEIAVRTG